MITNLEVKNSLRVNGIITQLEREMTEEQILMDRAMYYRAWQAYGEAKKRFAACWDELNRVKQELTKQTANAIPQDR